MINYYRLGGLMAAGFSVLVTGAQADSVSDFYKGKTVNFIIGSAPGAGYDIYGRLTARAMAKHIPGSPDVLARNMPGASSRAAAAHVYNIAPKDGLTLCMINQELPLAQALGETFQFDTAKFNWIGTPDTDNRVVVTWHASGVKTIADAKKKEVTMGTIGPTEATGYPDMLNTLAGTKFKSIKGYDSGGAVALAMERGEIDGRASNAWESWKNDRADWVRENKIHVIVQVGLVKVPDLQDVPLLMDLAPTPEGREVIKLISSPTMLGHPIVVAPGVPEERVKALRAAFDAAMSDPVVLADAEKQRRPLRPVSGVEMQKIVAEMLAAPKPVREQALALTQEQKPQ